MGWRGLFVTTLAGLVLSAACSDSTQQSAATAPPTSDATTTTTIAATTSSAPPTTNTTVPEAAARLAEVEEIFRDLEFRRLDALYRNDEEAFRALFANEAYLEESLGALDLELPFNGAPAPGLLNYITFEILVDTEDCLAASTRVIAPEVLEGESDLGVTVLTRRDDGSWGFAFVGSGWLCNGPHPLESDG
jgi:hypothetical protein